MNLMHFSKRAVISLLIIGSMIIAPLRASAIFVPIFDQATLSLEIKEYGLDMAVKLAAYALQQTIIETLQDWILSGFEDNPSFVVNPRDLVMRAEENAAGAFQLQLANSNVCQSYRGAVNRAVAQAAIQREDKVLNRQAQVSRVTGCMVDQLVTSGNVDNYFGDAGFVNEGGYAPFLQMLYNPADNPLEAPAVAVALQQQRQALATYDAEKEVDRSGGFEGMKECVEGNLGSCLRFNVQTPGKSVGELLERSLGQPFDQLASVDELSELVVGFIGALTTQAIQGLR